MDMLTAASATARNCVKSSPFASRHEIKNPLKMACLSGKFKDFFCVAKKGEPKPMNPFLKKQP
jgi:hypothetical protein